MAYVSSGTGSCYMVDPWFSHAQVSQWRHGSGSEPGDANEMQPFTNDTQRNFHPPPNTHNTAMENCMCVHRQNRSLISVLHVSLKMSTYSPVHWQISYQRNFVMK